jgi:hypothetical protein
MHWQAWCGDGSLLVVDDDGWNFDGAWNFAHALRVTGAPPDHRVEPLADLHVLRRGDSLRRRPTSAAPWRSTTACTSPPTTTTPRATPSRSGS